MIMFNGPVYDSSGYASASRLAIRVLSDIFKNLIVCPYVNWSLLGAKLSRHEYELLDSLIQRNNIPLGLLVNSYEMQLPRKEFPKGTVDKRIVYTMFETDRCPDGWAELLNSRADFVLLPSTFGVEAFSQDGVKNCQCMPFYIDTDLFNPVAPKTINFSGYKFLAVGDLSERKNIVNTISVFLKTFSGNKDVCLVVKTWVGYKQENVEQFMQKTYEMRKYLKVGDYPKVYLLNHIIPEDAIPGFINSMDCFVSASCGEGFGLPHLYSMSCEKPIISIDWSSCMDYVDSEVGLPLEYSIKNVPYGIVQRDRNFYGHDWAYPNFEHLAYCMRWVFEHQNEARELGQKGRQRVVEKYSFPVIRDRMKSFCQENGIS